MRLKHVYALLVGIIPVVTSAQENIFVHFEQANYSVLPNQSLMLRVIMDPVPAGGLFSYGVKVEGTQDYTVENVVLPAALDFNGTEGAGAIRLLDGGNFGAKGTVEFGGEITPYSENILATFNILNTSGLGGNPEVIQLDFFRTLGETETLFVDGLGNSLDGVITFGSATLTVVPEPRATWILPAGILVLCLKARGFLAVSR